MDSIPNEVVRMLFEHMSHQQRMSVARVCKIWNFLIATLLKIPKSYSFKKQIGSLCSKDCPFTYPYSITFDKEDNIVVAEYKSHYRHSNHRIQIIDQNDGFFAQGSMYIDCNHPPGVSTNQRNGNIIVSDSYNRIQVFDEKGKFLMFGSERSDDRQSNGPTRVAIDERNGNIIVSDYGNHRIQVFDERGKLLMMFGSDGSKYDGQFDEPKGVAIDQSKRNLLEERRDFFKKYGSHGSEEEGQFHGPRGIAVDQRNGNIIFADSWNDRIQVFDEKGKFLMKFGSDGSNDGQFEEPTGVAVTREEGMIIVADGYNDRIQVFNERGDFICKFGSNGKGEGQFEDVIGVSILLNGDVVCWDLGKIQIFTPNY